MTRDPYPFKLDDGGSHLSLRPLEKSDCTVRAFAITTQLPYDWVFDVFAAAGRRPNSAFASDKWLKKCHGRVFGGRFKAVPIRKHATPLSFGRAYPVGRFVLENEEHTWPLIDGFHHDLSRIDDHRLTGAWLWHPPS